MESQRDPFDIAVAVAAVTNLLHLHDKLLHLHEF